MIQIKRYTSHHNKKANCSLKNKKKQKEKNCTYISIYIYNHAETGGQISGNHSQNANQDGVIIKECGIKNKSAKVKKVNFEDKMKNKQF